MYKLKHGNCVRYVFIDGYKSSFVVRNFVNRFPYVKHNTAKQFSSWTNRNKCFHETVHEKENDFYHS